MFTVKPRSVEAPSNRYTTTRFHVQRTSATRQSHRNATKPLHSVRYTRRQIPFRARSPLTVDQRHTVSVVAPSKRVTLVTNVARLHHTCGSFLAQGIPSQTKSAPFLTPPGCIPSVCPFQLSFAVDTNDTTPGSGLAEVRNNCNVQRCVAWATRLTCSMRSVLFHGPIATFQLLAYVFRQPV